MTTSSSTSWAAAAICVAFLAMLTVGMVACSNTPCLGEAPQTVSTHADGRVDVVCP